MDIFPQMEDKGTEDGRVGNVTNHKFDKPSGSNYKDKVSTKPISYTNPFGCTQEVEQQSSQSLL